MKEPKIAPPSQESLSAACREAGLRATPQRIAVLRTLKETGTHPSPESIYNTVREQIPSISKATVYATLETLRTAGVIKEVAVLAETKRYDGNEMPHHHLVCTECKRIIDTVNPDLDIQIPHNLPGFVASEIRIQILGRCTDCASAQDKEKEHA